MTKTNFYVPFDRQPLPEGAWFHAVVEHIQVKTRRNTRSGANFDVLQWQFHIVEPRSPFHDRKVWGTTGLGGSPTLRKWTQAVVGHDVPKVFQLDTTELHGRRVRVLIGHRPDRNGGD